MAGTIEWQRTSQRAGESQGAAESAVYSPLSCFGLLLALTIIVNLVG
jgi:hypothetical protein